MKNLVHVAKIMLCIGICLFMVACDSGSGGGDDTPEPIPVTGVTLDRETLYLVVGDTVSITAQVIPENTDDRTLVWSSDNTDVATVGTDGSITAVDPGEATITVSAGGGAFSDECLIRVLADESFISIWDMSKTATNTLTIPLDPGGSYDFTIDWGDGTSEAITSENATHTYAEEGVYTIVITGTCEGFGFTDTNDEANEDNLVDVLRWGTVKFHNYGFIFAGCDNLLTFSAIDVPDLTGITTFLGMFLRAESFNADLSAWDTSGITHMNNTFSRAAAFNGDISTWNTSNVTDMSEMFFLASSFSSDITDWDTSRVENMTYMFRLASSFNQDISNWNTGEVTNFNSMFSGTGAFNQDISSWDTGNAEDMGNMFENNYSFNHDISGWDVFKVTAMQGMFWYARAYTNGGNPGGLSDWAVTDDCVTTNMFEGCPLDPLPDWYLE